MVGYRHSRLIKRFDLLDEWVDLIRTVEEAELGVEMKVYEATKSWLDSRRRRMGCQTSQSANSEATVEASVLSEG